MKNFKELTFTSTYQEIQLENELYNMLFGYLEKNNTSISDAAALMELKEKTVRYIYEGKASKLKTKQLLKFLAFFHKNLTIDEIAVEI